MGSFTTNIYHPIKNHKYNIKLFRLQPRVGPTYGPVQLPTTDCCQIYDADCRVCCETPIPICL